MKVVFPTQVFPVNISKFLRTLILKNIWKFIVTLKDFTTCSRAFIVDFEQVRAGWETKWEIDYRIHLKMNSAFQNYFIGKQSKWDQQNFLLIFLFKLCLFFCFICLSKTLNQKATVSEKKNNGYDFELY